MKAISDKIKKAIGKEDRTIQFPIRLKKSEKISWDKMAEENGFASTASLVRFMMKKAEKEPSKIFG